jgi:hypothetical protein
MASDRNTLDPYVELLEGSWHVFPARQPPSPTSPARTSPRSEVARVPPTRDEVATRLDKDARDMTQEEYDDEIMVWLEEDLAINPIPQPRVERGP